MFSVTNENTNQWVEWQSRSYTLKVPSWLVLVVSFLRGGKKKEYCSFHSNRESAEEWVGVGWQSGSEVEQEIRRGKTVWDWSTTWGQSGTTQKKKRRKCKRWDGQGQTACCLYFSVMYTFIHTSALLPRWRGKHASCLTISSHRSPSPSTHLLL